MARYLTVSALGPPMPPACPGRTNRLWVDFMKDHWRAQLASVWPDRPDLILLPEDCDGIRADSPEAAIAYYQERGDALRDFFAEHAAEYHCNIGYSAVRVLEDGTLRNTTWVLDRQGNVIGHYNKRHSTVSEIHFTDPAGNRSGRGEASHPVAGEALVHHTLTGREMPLIACDFGTVACLICFDLNFDDILAAYRRARPDLLLFSSMYHGGLLQAAWAYACQSHFIGACVDLPCTVLSPNGDILGQSSVHQPFVTRRVNLDCRVVHMDANMENIRAAKARYGTEIDVSIPGLSNRLLLSSLGDFSVEDVLREYDIESWDDYSARAQAEAERFREP